MVAEKKQASERPKAGEPPAQPPAGPATGEKPGEGGQGKPPAEGSTAPKRKAWIKKTPVEVILEQVKKQEEKVAALKKELEKEEGELKKMREATKMLGGS